MSTLLVELDLVRTAGAWPAMVHALLGARDVGHGTEMSYPEIAAELGTNVSMARRSIDKLIELDIITVVTQVERVTGQKANNYQVATQSAMGDPAHIEQAWRVTTSSNDSLEVSEVEVVDTSSSYSLLHTDDSVDNSPGLSMDADSCWVFTSWRWLPLGTEVPAVAMGKKNCFQHLDEALWLVAHLESYLLNQENDRRRRKGWKPQDRGAKGWVKRKGAWLRDAMALLQSQPLAEVVERLDWIMDHHKGILPFDIVDKNGLERWDKERMVTNLRKIAENYRELSTQFKLSTLRADELVVGDTVGVDPEKAWVNPIDYYTVEQRADLRRRLMAHKAS